MDMNSFCTSPGINGHVYGQICLKFFRGGRFSSGYQFGLGNAWTDAFDFCQSFISPFNATFTGRLVIPHNLNILNVNIQLSIFQQTF